MSPRRQLLLGLGELHVPAFREPRPPEPEPEPLRLRQSQARLPFSTCVRHGTKVATRNRLGFLVCPVCEAARG